MLPRDFRQSLGLWGVTPVDPDEAVKEAIPGELVSDLILRSGRTNVEGMVAPDDELFHALHKRRSSKRRLKALRISRKVLSESFLRGLDTDDGFEYRHQLVASGNASVTANVSIAGH